jgi:hypothetical protein
LDPLIKSQLLYQLSYAPAFATTAELPVTLARAVVRWLSTVLAGAVMQARAVGPTSSHPDISANNVLGFVRDRGANHRQRSQRITMSTRQRQHVRSRAMRIVALLEPFTGQIRFIFGQIDSIDLNFHPPGSDMF